jgi:two-component system chemotaxis response regulator CheB
MTPSVKTRIRVLVVDDSALVRRLLCESIARESDLEVVGVAPDPFVARDLIVQLKPDVLTLDIEMPRMDGLTFLTKLMHYNPMPAIIISSLGQASSEIALEALRRGAVEVLAKPSGPYSLGEVGQVLAQKIRAAYASSPKQIGVQTPVTQLTAAFPSSSMVAIGASTGGTQAIEEVLLHMPAPCPPMVIAQHIPAGFSTSFANRLNRLCKFEVKEAADGDRVQPGRALIAPGDFHMMLVKSGGGYAVTVRSGPRVHFQRPSVDVLFASVAEAKPAHSVGVLLTGMGADGAEGLLRMQQAGAMTIAQDEESCVVFGMPKAAIARGAAAQILPLTKIAHGIVAALASK